MKHYLKTWPEYFARIHDGSKRFEIRKVDDRIFQAGDNIVLQEWMEPGGLTGREIHGRITFVTDFMQMEDVVVFGFTTAKDAAKAPVSPSTISHLKDAVSTVLRDNCEWETVDTGIARTNMNSMITALTDAVLQLAGEGPAMIFWEPDRRPDTPAS